MALDTYTNLQAEVQDWLNRADLSAKVPTFITLLEAQLNRKLRVRQMITRATATISTTYTTLPTDFRALHTLELQTDPVDQLEFKTINDLVQIRRRYVAGKPKWYGVSGLNLEVAPVPDASYTAEITYWAAIPPLATSLGGTNWLLAEHPDLYLYGSLLQAAPYLNNDDRIPTWSSVVSGIIDDMTLADERATKSGVPLRASIRPYYSGR